MSDTYCSTFSCINSAEYYCDKCNKEICEECNNEHNKCSRYYCKEQDCLNKATWKCEGCKKILCEFHSDIPCHDCIECRYCYNKATRYCSGQRGCNNYVCSMNNCSGHTQACSSNERTLCWRCHGLRYFNNGRDPCPNCQASGMA